MNRGALYATLFSLVILAPTVTIAQPVNPGGGGAKSSVTDGITTVPNVSLLNFTSGVSVTNAGGGTANVLITGVGGLPIRIGTANPEPSFFIGQFSGASSPAASQFLGGLGPYAAESVSATILELEAYGHGAAIATVDGGGIAVGTSAGAAMIHNSLFYIGADAGRDVYDVSGSMGIGNGALGDGSPTGYNLALGGNAIWGSASTITVGGTPTTGDVIQLSVNTTNACAGSTGATGLAAGVVNCTSNNHTAVATWPAVTTYTVQAGDTTAAILAASLATAFTGAGNTNYILGDGVEEGTHNLFNLGFQRVDPSGNPTVIKGHYPGSWFITLAVTCTSGTCGETFTVGPGFTGSNNFICCNNIFNGPLLSNPQFNMLLTIGAPTSHVTNPIAITGIGYRLGSAGNMVNPNFIAYLGNDVFANLSTGAHLTGIGPQVGGTCSTAVSVLLLGTGSTTDCTAGGETNAIHMGAGNGDIFFATGTNVPATSVSRIAGVLNTIGVYQANGTPGVSCTVGTLTPVTAVVTNGIITHC